MKNFRLVYRHLTDNYLDVDSTSAYSYDELDGIDIDEYMDYSDEYLLNLISKYRGVIVKDFERYLTYVVKRLENNEGLASEMQNVIDSYNNGVDYTMNNDSSFIILTDDYLCFNNVENEIDELLLSSLDEEEAIIYETMVIVNRNYKEFYFIIKTTNILKIQENVVVKAFSIRNDKVFEKIFNQKIDTKINNYDDEDIKEMLVKIKKLEKIES